MSYRSHNSDKWLELFGRRETGVSFTETTADTMKLALGCREAIGPYSFSPRVWNIYSLYGRRSIDETRCYILGCGGNC